MTLPGLFLIEFDGWWESEPGNAVKMYVNPNFVTCVLPHKYNDDGEPVMYQMSIQGNDDRFILSAEELSLVKGDGFGLN